ncbi:MAG: ATP-dependent helicase HrpB, partial [Bryobacteraceae bacterium]
IDPMLGAITEAVERNPITLLEAEPGAGKTTRVPAALLRRGYSGIYVLEPRRLAARLAARRVAEELHEPLGQSVGYQVRFEEVGSRQTRLWFVTEGVLTRKLLSDPALRQAQVVVLDEFHERHLETDLALALLRKLQRRRPELKLLIMSATLSGDDLSARLGGAPLLRSPGRVFPVTVRYRPHSAAPLEAQTAEAISVGLSETRGHILAFLPGAAEIRAAAQACDSMARAAGAVITPLHGDLPPEEQDRAVAPSKQRKIILSTNVAESSVTVEGVCAVVDSGLARVATYSPWSGFTRLRVEKVSRGSVAQRTGRAGRTGPGLAIRLFTEEDFRRRPEHLVPELLRSDLAQVTLQLAAVGFRWTDLDWLDEPSLAAREEASDALLRLGALAPGGGLTTVGRSMSQLPLHPRLSRFFLEAAERGVAEEAATVAALLSEGRYRSDEAAKRRHVSDIEALLETNLSFPARRLSQQLLRSVSKPARHAACGEHALEKALLVAYSDRVARRRGETLLISTGASAKLDRAGVVESEFLLALDIEDRLEMRTALVRVASPIEADWLLDLFPDRLETRELMEWNREAERVEQVSALVYDKLVIDETRRPATDADAAAALLAQKAMEAGIERFVDAEELNRFMQRIQFAALHSKSIRVPHDLVEQALRALSYGLKSFSELRSATSSGALVGCLEIMLPMREINETAPEFVHLPSGRRARIHYVEGQPPWVSSRLQDFFGMKNTPVVARGAVPLVVHLLAPNQRPVQMTTDLTSFWNNLYPQLRRELSRRYPKHAWPERPE